VRARFPSFMPPLLISTAVSTTFDWNLFLLGRYSEGLQLGLSNDHCVENTVKCVWGGGGEEWGGVGWGNVVLPSVCEFAGLWWV
jgi:hypothetical protein